MKTTLFLIFTLLPTFLYSANQKSLLDIDWKKTQYEDLLKTRIKNLVDLEAQNALSHIDVQIQLDKKKLLLSLEPQSASTTISEKALLNSTNLNPITKFDLETEAVQFKQQNTTQKAPEIDIYRFFKSIEVILYIKPQLAQSQQKLILDFVKKNFASYGGVAIAYSLRPSIGPLKTNDKKVVPNFWNQRRQDYLIFSALATLVIFGLLLAARTIYKGITYLTEAFKKACETDQTSGTLENEDKNINSQVSDEGKLNKGRNSSPTKISFDKHEGIKKFKAIFHQSPKRAGSLLKQWLQDSTPESNSALYMVLRSIGIEEMQEAFKMLEGPSKRQIKRILSLTMLEIDPDLGDDFLQDQISTAILYRDKIKNPRLEELINEADTSSIKAILHSDLLAGAYLMTLLPPFQGVKLSQDLDEKTFFSLASLPLEIEVPDAIVGKLINYLSKASYETKRLPVILENIEEYLSSANPAREETILKLALTHFTREEFLDICFKFFPVCMAQSLPLPATFKIFNTLRVSDKIGFLLNLDESIRIELMDLIGPAGSRAREMYEVDLAKNLSNEVLLEKSKNDSLKIWYTFTTTVRKMVNTDEIFRRQAGEIISTWIDHHAQNYPHSDHESAA
jgi:hypothetical protein